jgi:hypothetical protein
MWLLTDYVYQACDGSTGVSHTCTYTGVQEWPGEQCQDPKAKVQAPGRCWQSSLEKARAICERQWQHCAGITRGHGGYEPRSGGFSDFNPTETERWDFHRAPPAPAPTGGDSGRAPGCDGIQVSWCTTYEGCCLPPPPPPPIPFDRRRTGPSPPDPYCDSCHRRRLAGHSRDDLVTV